MQAALITEEMVVQVFRERSVYMPFERLCLGSLRVARGRGSAYSVGMAARDEEVQECRVGLPPEADLERIEAALFKDMSRGGGLGAGGCWRG